ncbi:uncharacterized protein [Salminus brasiliensis]|uniref:uncharacterized protein n=1 Tax=Salminus brasiliensis TaxID=930266 RepID=UPI003B82D62D
MAEQTGLTSLDNLLLQLVLRTRELSQKKEELKQQIEMYRSSIQDRTKYIDETRKSIKKLEEEILQKQKTVECFKENVKSLRGTNNLLLQYEKTLETELERRQESCNRDMKVFQERIDNYRNIFQQYKEEYSQNPLAKKLLNIQAKNEELEKSIQAKEEEIIAKEKELKDLRETEQEAEMEEKAVEHNQDRADGCDEYNASQVGTLGSTVWTKPYLSCEQIEDAEQKQQQKATDVGSNMNTSYGPDIMEEMMKGMEVEDQQEGEGTANEESTNDGAAPSSPVRMTAMLNTPTFSLNSSPSNSPSHQQSSEASAFVFSLNSGPSTPGFSGFGCNFDVGSNQSEKSPETKLPGFLFDELESRPDEEFAFSFCAKSPQPSSSSQEPGTGGTGEVFPFSFSFGKF